MEKVNMKPHRQSPIVYLVFLLLLIPGAVYTYNAYISGNVYDKLWIGLANLIAALFIAGGVKIGDQWEKAVVLRLGKFRALKGPGMFFIIPLVDTIPYWIDHRVITTTFKAEKTLSKDTVPVDVEAVLFWKVTDSVKAALEVEDYRTAISWASQTALREVIGKSELSDILEGRDRLDNELQKIIDLKTEQWGVHVMSVEIRDVLIPAELQDAMSMQAQAERERQARVILGDSERQVAEKFEEAAKTYANNPTALHLRAMNMLYEGLKEKATMVLVPASVLDTMSLGDVTGIAALSKNLAREMMEEEKAKEEKANKEKNLYSGSEDGSADKIES